MFLELPIREYRIVSPLFEGHLQHLPVMSVIEGRFPGRVFVDNADSPKVALVWTLSRWAYIAGDASTADLTNSIKQLISQVVIPDSAAMGMNWFELYSVDDPDWRVTMEQSLQTFDLDVHMESVYEWDVERYRSLRSQYRLPRDLVVEKAEVLILRDAVRHSEIIPSRFKNSIAIGYRVIEDGEAVAQCRSNGFEAGNRFMIDVVTFNEDSRGKGYATAASVGLLDYCLEHDLQPLWETTEDNIPSQKLAARLGFVAVENYPVHAIEF